MKRVCNCGVSLVRALVECDEMDGAQLHYDKAEQVSNFLKKTMTFTLKTIMMSHDNLYVFFSGLPNKHPC